MPRSGCSAPSCGGRCAASTAGLPGALEIDTTVDGHLWATRDYSVLRVAAAGGRRTPVMSLHRVRQATGVDCGAFNAAERAPDGAPWIGGWHGTVLRAEGDEVRLISPREAPSTGRIHDTANDPRVLDDSRLAVAINAGLRLVKSPDDIRSFDRYNPGMPGSFVHSVSTDADGRLWMTRAYWGASVTWRSGIGFGNRNTRDGLFADRLVAVANDAQDRAWPRASDGREAIYDRERLMRRGAAAGRSNQRLSRQLR